VYFQDTLIIFTSNLGISIPSPDNPSRQIENVSYESTKDYETVREKVISGVRQYFNERLGRPEILNRIGNNILVFDYIREESLDPILEKQIRHIAENLWSEKHIRLQISSEAMQDLHALALADLPKGQGGRGIGNMVEEMLLNPLARYLFDNMITKDTVLEVGHVYREGSQPNIKVKIIG
jgi:ATP-dependent Clp protease ATP-binding subunit ClpA